MRFFALAGLVAPVLVISVALLDRPDAADARDTMRPDASPQRLVGVADQYRRVTWTYQRAARTSRTPSSLSYRRSHDGDYLRWTVSLWRVRADRAQRRALAVVRQRAGVSLPKAPAGRAPIVRRIAYHRALTWQLQRVATGHVTHGSAAFRRIRSSAYRQWALRLWQERAAKAALLVARRVNLRRALASARLVSAFRCIHRYEGAWTSNSGNGYYGGLQMDRAFMRMYGRDFLRRWGTADQWPAWAQIETAARAHRSGRGFWPWPNSARACGLL
jgi:hypothetical protein